MFTEARTDVATALAAEGFTVTTDPATVNPPCAVVGPITNVRRETSCGYVAEVTVYLVAPAPGGATSLAWLESNLGAFLAAVRPDTETDVVLGTFSHATGELPAYQTTTQSVIGG